MEAMRGPVFAESGMYWPQTRGGEVLSILSRVRGQLRSGTPLDLPIVIMVFLIPVSLWAAFEALFCLPKALGLLLGVAAYYATVAFAHDEPSLRKALAAYFSLGTAVAVMGLVGTGWLYKNPAIAVIVDHLPKLIRGLPGASEGFHPNEVAGVLLWMVPLQWTLLIWEWRRSKALDARLIWLALSTFLTTTTMLLTQSRGAFLGLAAWIVILAATRNRRVGLAIALLALAALVYAVVRGPVWINRTLRWGMVFGLFGKLNWESRTSIWKQALRGIQDFPLTGMGIGAFRRTVWMLYPLGIIPTYDVAHAHNAFLQAALDFGLLGLLAYIALWWRAAAMTLFTLGRARGWPGALALGLGGCQVAYFVYSLLDAVALGAKPEPLWWMMLALIVSAWRLSQKPAAPINRGAEQSHEA